MQGLRVWAARVSATWVFLLLGFLGLCVAFVGFCTLEGLALPG